MKNLIYTCATENYLKIFELFLKSVRRFDNTDILCITNEHSFLEIKNFKNVYFYRLPDHKFTWYSRFLIQHWEMINYYKNILYLDCDILCLNNLLDIFKTINYYPNTINCVMENFFINKTQGYHKFSDSIFPESQIAYNSGTFGFNLNLLKEFDDFCEFIKENKSRVSGFYDQPLFNEYFINKNLIKPHLSKYVLLKHFEDNSVEQLKDRHPISLVHFLGNYSNQNYKYNEMKTFYRKVKNKLYPVNSDLF